MDSKTKDLRKLELVLSIPDVKFVAIAVYGYA
jgi:hypothetical protein